MQELLVGAQHLVVHRQLRQLQLARRRIEQAQYHRSPWAEGMVDIRISTACPAIFTDILPSWEPASRRCPAAPSP